MPNETSPQAEFNFEAQTNEKLRDKYLLMVGSMPPFHINNDAVYLEQVTSSPEAAASERTSRMNQEREEDRELREKGWHLA